MKNILYINLFFCFTSILFSSEIMDRTYERIQEIIPSYKNIIHDIYPLGSISKNIQNTIKQNFYRNELNVWQITTNDDLKFYAVLDNVKGKSMPITFLAIFNSNKEIENVSIIKYREPYGGEIRNSNWLKQFINYSDSSNYKIGKGIDNISGATISVKSVSKGIHKLSLIINYIITYFNGN